uniref:Uncharacterized protein n=1 Tax=Oryza punctata TaxID=4537 RepID=A0A0E0MJC9_ORYPU
MVGYQRLDVKFVAYLERNQYVGKGLAVCVMEMNGEIVHWNKRHYSFKHSKSYNIAVPNKAFLDGTIKV